MSFTLEIFLKTILWIGGGSILMYFMKFCYDCLRIVIMGEKFGGEKRNVILGNFELLRQPTDIIYKRLLESSRKYYPHFSVRLLSHTAICIASPEDCEIFLGTKKHAIKSDIYRVLENWLKEGLLLSKGEKWIQRRRILTPAFHFSILKDFVGVFNEQTDRLLDIINDKCKDTIDIVPLASEFALYTINESAMGHKIDPSDKNQKKYRDSIFDIEKIFEHRLFTPWLHSNLLYFLSYWSRKEKQLLNILQTFTQTIIKKRMNTFESIAGLDKMSSKEESEDDNIYIGKKKRRLAMLDVLLQAKLDGEQIDYQGICEEVDTFMFEGHDTTAAAIGFSLMLIACHPEIQENIYKEVKTILNGRTKPTYNDLSKMDLLERTIKESLRLYPSVYFISRLIEEDTVCNSGVVAPKGAYLVVLIFCLHRNPDLYPNPEKFDPDRFLIENCADRHPYAYIPFSAGPRNCIGQRFAMLELKTVICGILQRFKITPIDTPETITLKPEILLRAKNGIKMKFHPRNES